MSQTATETQLAVGQKVEPFEDWPNDHGFDGDSDVREPVPLEIQGQIPAYAAGVLYRTGPGGRKVETAQGNVHYASHWFDGFSQVHRFQISAPAGETKATSVRYNSRTTVDTLIEDIRRKGSLDGFSFGQKRDPCESYFKKILTTFSSTTRAANGDPNIGVTLSVNTPGLPSAASSQPDKERPEHHASGIQSLWVKTDAATLKRLDPETLEPLGLAQQSVLHPKLKGQTSAAHAKSDPETGDVFNFNLEMGHHATYRVFHVSVATGETTILATIKDAPAAYLHSFFLTENYVLLCVWNSRFKVGGASMLWNQNILDSIAEMDTSKPAKWYVIDRRHGQGIKAVYESDALYCFHTINAWEERSPSNPQQTDIVADMPVYRNLDILKRFYYDSLLSTSADAHAFHATSKAEESRAVLRRYRLPSITDVSNGLKTPGRASLEWTMPSKKTPELPIINPSVVTRPYRYVYGVADRGKSTFVDGLIKFNTQTRETTVWEKHGHSPGEAIFVADPEAKDVEDGGVLLSVVLDGERGTSYLLCLDARTMKELGRAEMSSAVGFGFHGCHVPAKGSPFMDF